MDAVRFLRAHQLKQALLAGAFKLASEAERERERERQVRLLQVAEKSRSMTQAFGRSLLKYSLERLTTTQLRKVRERRSSVSQCNLMQCDGSPVSSSSAWAVAVCYESRRKDLKREREREREGKSGKPFEGKNGCNYHTAACQLFACGLIGQVWIMIHAGQLGRADSAAQRYRCRRCNANGSRLMFLISNNVRSVVVVIDQQQVSAK